MTVVTCEVTHCWTAMLEALGVSWLSHSLLTRLAEPPSPTSDPTLEQKHQEEVSSHEQSSHSSHSGGNRRVDGLRWSRRSRPLRRDHTQRGRGHKRGQSHPS